MISKSTPHKTIYKSILFISSLLIVVGALLSVLIHHNSGPGFEGLVRYIYSIGFLGIGASLLLVDFIFMYIFNRSIAKNQFLPKGSPSKILKKIRLFMKLLFFVSLAIIVYSIYPNGSLDLDMRLIRFLFFQPFYSIGLSVILLFFVYRGKHWARIVLLFFVLYSLTLTLIIGYFSIDDGFQSYQLEEWIFAFILFTLYSWILIFLLNPHLTQFIEFLKERDR